MYDGVMPLAPLPFALSAWTLSHPVPFVLLASHFLFLVHSSVSVLCALCPPYRGCWVDSVLCRLLLPLNLFSFSVQMYRHVWRPDGKAM